MHLFKIFAKGPAIMLTESFKNLALIIPWPWAFLVKFKDNLLVVGWNSKIPLCFNFFIILIILLCFQTS